LLSHIGKANDIKIAGQTSGIDLVLGGHSHQHIKEVFKSKSGEPVIVFQAGRNGDKYGTLDVEFDDKGVLVFKESDLETIPVKSGNKQKVNLTNEITKFNHTDFTQEDIETEQLMLNVLGNEKMRIGELAEPYNPYENSELYPKPENGVKNKIGGKSPRRDCENPLASFTADALLWNANNTYNANVDAVMMTGSHDFLVQKFRRKEITNRDILDFLPFKNRNYKLKLSGKEIKQILEWGVTGSINSGEKPREGERPYRPGFIQVAGIRYKAKTTEDGQYLKQDPLAEIKIKKPGTGNQYEDVEESRIYTVLLDNNFMRDVVNFETPKISAIFNKPDRQAIFAQKEGKTIEDMEKAGIEEGHTKLHKKDSLLQYIKDQDNKGRKIEIKSDGRIQKVQ